MALTVRGAPPFGGGLPEDTRIHVDEIIHERFISLLYRNAAIITSAQLFTWCVSNLTYSPKLALLCGIGGVLAGYLGRHYLFTEPANTYSSVSGVSKCIFLSSAIPLTLATIPYAASLGSLITSVAMNAIFATNGLSVLQRYDWRIQQSLLGDSRVEHDRKAWMRVIYTIYLESCRTQDIDPSIQGLMDFIKTFSQKNSEEN